MIDFLSKLPIWLLLSLSATAVITGDYLAKYWSVNQHWYYFVLAIFGYILTGIFFIPTLLKEGLVVSALIWVLLDTIGFTLIGLLIFKEILSGVQVAGLIFGLLSLTLLNLKS